MYKIMCILLLIMSNCNSEEYSNETRLQVTKIIIEKLEERCDDNIAGSCHNLALIYAGQKGIIREEFLPIFKDEFKAFDLFNKSCKLNYVNSCYSVGMLYAKGLGVRQDWYKAKKYFGIACDKKSSEGCEMYTMVKNALENN